MDLGINSIREPENALILSLKELSGYSIHSSSYKGKR